MDEKLAVTLERWADLDSAAQAILVAQPRQMSDAAERLDKARLAMRAALQALTRPNPTAS